jgi:hypothetical protein
MMTSNACDAERLQAEQRKRSKYRIIMIPSTGVVTGVGRYSYTKSRNLQVTVFFKINVLINPQTTSKVPANVNSGLPNAFIAESRRI